MKNECEIVQDLLISYNDDVLNPESKKLVEEHLKTCEKCREKLEIIRKEPSDHKEQYIVNYMKKLRRKTFVKSVCIAICFVLLIFVGAYFRKVYIISNYINNVDKLLQKENIYIEQVSTLYDGVVNITKNYYKDGKRKEVISNYSDSGEEILFTRYNDSTTNKEIFINEYRKILEEKEALTDDSVLKLTRYFNKETYSFLDVLNLAFTVDIDIEYESERYTSEKIKFYALKLGNKTNTEYWIEAKTGLLNRKINRYKVTNYFPTTNIIKEIINKEDIDRYYYSFDTVTDLEVTPNNLDEYTKPKLVKTLSPSGFAGSSLYRIDLYSNGDLNFVKLDGNGNEISNGVFSKNVEDIQSDGEGGILVLGDNVDSQYNYSAYSWLKYVGKE